MIEWKVEGCDDPKGPDEGCWDYEVVINVIKKTITSTVCAVFHADRISLFIGNLHVVTPSVEDLRGLEIMMSLRKHDRTWKSH